MRKSEAPSPSKLHELMFRYRVSLREGGELWQTSHETLRRARLSFDHPDWRAPSTDVMQRIIAWFEGEMTVADFFPPEMSPTAANDATAGAGLATAGAAP